MRVRMLCGATRGVGWGGGGEISARRTQEIAGCSGQGGWQPGNSAVHRKEDERRHAQAAKRRLRVHRPWGGKNGLALLQEREAGRRGGTAAAQGSSS